jgi:hypothetical protein
MHIKKLLLILAVLALLVCYFFGEKISMSMKTEGYQAVFLTSGQVYFGKLEASGSWLKLADIYYLQTSQPLQTTNSNTPLADANQNIQLVKLGNELHGPTDAMYIGRKEVLFWENIKDDSKVLDAINKYKGQ